MHGLLLIAFWSSAAVLLYTYVGYGALVAALVRARRMLAGPARHEVVDDPPDVPLTLLVAAYNEEAWIEEKIANCLALDYPRSRLRYLFVTDGSTDRTPDIVRRHREVDLMHQPRRAGKIAAVQRAMREVTTPLVVFTDANTFLNRDALSKLVRHFADPRVGAVAGEKRVVAAGQGASGTGEGLYWRYESALKRWDSELNSVVGAAGELFALRTELFEDVPQDTIIEDFYLTLRVAERGFSVRYEPEAVALESPSASVGEELKRKIRIAAGGIQSVVRLRGLLNPLRHGLLTWQYLSHRVLRWTVAPLALVVMLLSHLALAVQGEEFYRLGLVAHLGFYLAALAGWVLDRRQRRIRSLVVPYYFCVMNYAVWVGFYRYLRGSQTVLWERAKRA